MLFDEILFENLKEREDQLNEIRRFFHRIPELGFEEVKTSQAIGEFLREMGIEAQRLEPTGLVAYIGPSEGPVLALRADIDALQVTEDTGLEYASCHPGLMHACGHDGHVAGLLGAARILKDVEDQLSFRVKLIFQPSEENTLGAKKIIADGVLDDVDAAFGLHLFSDIPYGRISVEPGPRMAQTDRFTITFEGKGGHAGKPHLCVDATVMAADFLMSAQTIVAREIDPVDPAVLTVGSFHSGTQYNIISPKAVLQGTCRSFSVETADILRQAIEKRAKAVAESYGGSVEIDYDFGSHPPVCNDSDFSKAILKEAKSYMTNCEFVSIPPLMLGEDFSWYQERVPGVFAFVGCGKIQGESFPNHHPKFDMEEKALLDCLILHLSAVSAFSNSIKKDE